MSSERWEEVERRFFELVELEGESRAAGLAELSRTDPELCVVLRRLLAVSERADELLRPFEALISSPPPLGSAPDPRRVSHGPDPERLIGRVISHYEVRDLLGAGGMGVLYRAVDTRLGRTVALKFLPPHRGLAATFEERFQREARAAAALDHPNICTIHEIGDTDEGQPFIAMAFYRGETVREKLARGPLDVGEALDLARQTARGLAAAHGAGLVHRDIKPANLMVTEGGRLKILDFGVAKTDDTALTDAGLRLGTVAYMSPEQSRGAQVDARTDLWSLGVVLYEMLTGRRPFRGGNDRAVLDAIRHEEPEPPSAQREGLPVEIDALVLQLLSKDPEGRPKGAARLTGSPAGRGPERAARRLLRRARPRVVIAAAAIVLLVAATLAGFLAVREGGEARTASVALADVARRPRIAVLPFETRSLGGEESAFVAAGLHDEILTLLSRIDGLRVTWRTSGLPYSESDRNIRQIARTLGVDYVVEGIVQRVGDRLRVTVQLVDAETNAHVWAETYASSFSVAHVFAIQADVAQRIAGALEAEITPRERAAIEAVPTTSAEAYRLYRRGRALSGDRLEASDEWRALELFERAVELDPDFALARVGIALAKIELYGHGTERAVEVVSEAKRLLDDLLLEHPEMPEVHEALGRYHYRMRDYAAAHAAWLRVEDLAPGAADLDFRLANVFRRQGMWTQALEYRLRGLEADPENANRHMNLAFTYLNLRRFERARASAERALELDPSFPFALEFAARAAIEIEGAGAARRILERVPADVVGSARLVLLLAWLDQWEGEHRDALRRLRLLPDEPPPDAAYAFPVGLWRARSLIALGDPAAARVELSRDARLLEARVRRRPEDHRAWGALGLVYASLSRGEEAIEAASKGVELMPVDRDAILGPGRVEELALVYAWTGHPDEAVDRLEYLLSIPSLLTRTWLERDPRWDPLRTHPRFEALLASASE